MSDFVEVIAYERAFEPRKYSQMFEGIRADGSREFINGATFKSEWRRLTGYNFPNLPPAASSTTP